jgi:hypothetical protein
MAAAFPKELKLRSRIPRCSAVRLVAVYPEILVFSPVLTPLCGYVGYLRAGRTLVQLLCQLLKLLPFSLGLDFHTPIVQIPYSSVQAKSCCLLKDEPPVEHALDDAGDNGMQRCSVRLFCHE